MSKRILATLLAALAACGSRTAARSDAPAPVPPSSVPADASEGSAAPAPAPPAPPAPIVWTAGDDALGPIRAVPATTSTAALADALRAALPGLAVEAVVRDTSWARYEAVAIRDGEDVLFDVIPGAQDGVLVDVRAPWVLDPPALTEEANATRLPPDDGPAPACKRHRPWPGELHCASTRANLRWRITDRWDLDDRGQTSRALWWPAGGGDPDRFVPRTAPGLAVARVIALAGDRKRLVAAVGPAGITVVRELSEPEPGISTTRHACRRADVRRALAPLHAHLLRQLISALVERPLVDDPGEGGVTCTGDRCVIQATNEGEPKYTLVFASADAAAPLTAITERDDWQSPDLDAHDAAVAQALASHRCP